MSAPTPNLPRCDGPRTSGGVASHELCQSVAHDLNNLLTCIMGQAELLEFGDAEAADAREAILSASYRARELVLQMLAPDRDLQPGPIPVGPTLAALGRELRKLADPRTTLEVFVFDSTACTLGLVRDVEQIVSNLVLNAFAATNPSGGCVQLSLRPSGRDRLLIEVADDGQGIAHANRARVFEPGFTTHQRGTGLGLAFVAQAVERMKGSIEIDSSNAGTRVRVKVPRAATPRG